MLGRGQGKTYEQHHTAPFLRERPGDVLQRHAGGADAVDEEDLAAILGPELIDAYIPVLNMAGKERAQSQASNV